MKSVAPYNSQCCQGSVLPCYTRSTRAEPLTQRGPVRASSEDGAVVLTEGAAVRTPGQQKLKDRTGLALQHAGACDTHQTSQTKTTPTLNNNKRSHGDSNMIQGRRPNGCVQRHQQTVTSILANVDARPSATPSLRTVWR